MREEAFRQIREEMQRSYKPREMEKPSELGEAGEACPVELLELRSAVGALYSSYALVGQTPPEPPTFRGRMGARLVGIVRRLLFWYTPQIVHFQYSALKAFESALQALENQSRCFQSTLQDQSRSFQEHETRSQQLEAELRRERREMQVGLAAANSRVQVAERRLEALRLQTLPRLDREMTRIRAQQSVQEEDIARALQARAGYQELAQAPCAPPAAKENAHYLDSLYAALEDEFRGSHEEIKERLSVYLPVLAGAGIGSDGMPILDVGCGRGEWVELLRENQLHASGIDLNRVVLAIARERGLPVMEADAIEYLRSLPEASLGAVTAFHVIEHLELPRLLDLLDAARRALKPGGVAIFETPNPNNLFVSSRYFYIDPTHRHPIPLELGRFLVEARGFERVEILELHPWPPEHRVDTTVGGEIAARFNECFYGPQDYAIIGWKA